MPNSACFSDDGNFYTLNQKWEKANSGGFSQKAAVGKGFGASFQKDSSGIGPISTAPDVMRGLEDLSGSQRFIEIEQNQSLFVKTNQGIVKFISTDEGKVVMEKISPDILRIFGEGIGSTFIHVWTADEQRRTFEVRVIPQKFFYSASQTRQQEALDRSRSFKIGYNNSRSAFYSGDKFTEKSRGSLDFNQAVSLEGDTPYGAVSAHAQQQKARGKMLLTDAQVALKDGRIGPFRNFDIAGGDSRVTPGLMAFPGARLRGGVLDHWDNQKRMIWEGFYGREQASVIGTLTPGIETKRTLDSFLGGGVLDYKINENARIKTGYFTGSGRTRADELNRRGAGIKGDVNLGSHITFIPEVDYDNERFAQRQALTVRFDKFRLRQEWRDIGKKFETLVGAPGAQGELGYLLEGNATLSKNVVLTGSMDVFRDRLIPNPENLGAYNVHSDLSLSLNPWETSNLILSYQGIDDTGRLGPNRQKMLGAQFNQRVNFLGHKGNIFTRYQRRDNTILNNTLSDTHVDQVTAGYATQIFWGINFSVSQQVNFLDEFNIPDTSTPRAMVISLDRSSRIGNTPFFMDLGLQIRDEEETESSNSFMSGFDTTELSGGLYYREYENLEIFLTGSFQNYKPESLNIATPRIEFQFLTGVKYLFDTNLRWSSVGSFDGVVYKDLNGDGKRQPNEPGLEGVTIQAADNQAAITNEQGFYEFKSIAGKNVTFTLDTSKVPYGYVPTSSIRQELPIEQGKRRHLDFGVTPRSEIAGIVFSDLDGNGKYDLTDLGMRKVRLKLENGETIKTNGSGVYSFTTVLAGEHTVSIDVSTLPEGYLPAGVPKSTFTVFEGIRFEQNFPLRAIRAITGRVYLDANGNKRIDSEEKTFAGVRVLLAGQAILTDQDGWYLFDNLPSGAYELSVDEKTLPEGTSGPPKSEIQLSAEPVTITDANLALSEKS